MFIIKQFENIDFYDQVYIKNNSFSLYRRVDL